MFLSCNSEDVLISQIITKVEDIQPCFLKSREIGIRKCQISPPLTIKIPPKFDIILNLDWTPYQTTWQKETTVSLIWNKEES
jgi:hypothetical protein